MRFLSAEWLDRMAAATSAASPGAIAVSIHQRVTGGPDGDVEYTVRVADGRVTFEPGPGTADVEFVSDYGTAAAIGKGELSPAAAFADGRLRVLGSVGALVGAQEAFAGMGRHLAGVSESTTY